MIDPLGVKADVYRELALEQWGAVTRRTEVRLAIAIGLMGVALLIAGSITLVIMRDLTAIAAGIFCVGYCWNALWPLRTHWTASRAIGSVSLELADLNIVPGEHAPCAVRIVPRRDGVVQEIALVFEYRETGSAGGPTAWQVDVTVTDPQLQAGIARTFPADIVLPPGVPPSRFDATWTRQWIMAASVRLHDGREWQRDYPVLVYPTP